MTVVKVYETKRLGEKKKMKKKIHARYKLFSFAELLDSRRCFKILHFHCYRNFSSGLFCCLRRNKIFCIYVRIIREYNKRTKCTGWKKKMSVQQNRQKVVSIFPVMSSTLLVDINFYSRKFHLLADSCFIYSVC